MNKPVIKKGWLRTTIYLPALAISILLSGILGFIIISLINGKLSYDLQLQNKENIHLLIIYYLSTLGGVILVTVLFRKYIDRKDIVTLGFQRFHVKKDITLGILAGVICVATGFAILYASGLIMVEGISPDPQYLIGSFIMFILVSLLEEVSFRGYILNNLMESFHPLVALFVSALLFAFFHIFNPGLSLIGFTNLFLAGLFLGIIFIFTKTIWFALGLHFSWNFFQGPLFGFRVSGTESSGFLRLRTEGPAYLTGGEFGFEGSLICSVLIILSVFLLYRIHNSDFDKPLEKKY